VSIILNIVKPESKIIRSSWPKISFFAIYDGHGGSQCADFLKDRLHHLIINRDCFPENPEQAMREGFQEAE